MVLQCLQYVLPIARIVVCALKAIVLQCSQYVLPIARIVFCALKGQLMLAQGSTLGTNA
jgi:hypothetical protein